MKPKRLVELMQLAAELMEGDVFKAEAKELREYVPKVRAQADAQPVVDVWQETDENGMPVWNECSFGTSGNDFDFARPLYTRPVEAAAPELSDAEIDAIAAHIVYFDPLNPEKWRRMFARAILTRASAATVAEASPFKHYTAIERAGKEASERMGKLNKYLAQTSGAAQKQAEPIPRHKPRKIVLDDEQAEPGADERAAEAYVVMGYGETDLPQVSVVYGAGAAKAAVIGMIYHPSTDCPQDEREEYLHGFDAPDNWSQGEWEGLKFEIGGVRVWRADVSIAAQSGRRAGVVEGWQLVPKEPTHEQISAAQRAWLNDPARLSSTLYRAMLAAAPTQQQEENSK